MSVTRELLVRVVALSLAGYGAGALAADSASHETTGSTETNAPAVRESAQGQLQQKALDILKAASDTLAAAKTLSFTALIEEEGPALDSGRPLLFSRTATVALQRPDKLRVNGRGSGPTTQFYYDGKTMTAWMPQENLVATMPAPPTIDAMLRAAFDAAAIYFPFTDVIVDDPYNDLAEGFSVAFYIGQSDAVGGTTTDMIAFGNDSVFVQAWIGTQDKLPRRLRAVYPDDPTSLRHDMVLSDWKLNARLPAATFVSNVPADAGNIPFQHPKDMVPTGLSPKRGESSTKPDDAQSKAPVKED